MVTENMETDDAEMKEALSELMTCSSYWARKTKLTTFAHRPGFSKLSLQLIEFDVAVNFKNAKDASSLVQQLYFSYPSNAQVKEKVGSLLSFLLEPNYNDFGQALIKEIPVENLLKMFHGACVEPAGGGASGNLRIYLTLAANNYSSLKMIGKKLFESYLSARADYIQQNTAREGKSSIDLTPYDLIFFSISKALVDSGFGDLALADVANLYHVMLRCAFLNSLNEIPEKLYSYNQEKLGTHKPKGCYWRAVTEVLIAFMKKMNVNPKRIEAMGRHSPPEFLKMTEALMTSSNQADLLQSQDVVFVLRLLLCYAFSKTKRINSDCKSLVVYIPANVYNIGPAALETFWSEMASDSSQKTATPVGSIRGDSNSSCLEAFKIIYTISMHLPICEATFLTAILNDTVQVENSLLVVVQALLTHGNFVNALAYISKELKEGFLPASGQKDARSIIVFVQYAQILQSTAIKASSEFRMNDQILKLFMDYIVLIEKLNLEPEAPFPVLPSGTDSFVFISEGNILAYVTLALFHLFWWTLVRIWDDDKLAAQKDFVMGFLIVLCQVNWREMGYLLLPQIMDHVRSKKTFCCPNLVKYINNTAMLNSITALSDVQFAISER
ncbi:hypothetical protein DdX_09582 [Ditylenchus destructor]|uniref:Uncharacterized protein n=1 Tax=Ditylenchus destructor TaxID=166010 RepID=A0AAD4R6D2_9BILA|nr:hypothetical protein DdX_09582 [Ditylenchus destructor]